MKELLSEIRNLHSRAASTNYAGSCELADSLDKSAGLKNLFSYVGYKLDAGL